MIGGVGSQELDPFARPLVQAGRGGAGELAGRAVVLIPFLPYDGLWDLNDIDWEMEGDYEASVWQAGEATSQQFRHWKIAWVSRDQLHGFISAHFWHLDVDALLEHR